MGQVRTQKESDRARGTNKLETADKETSQDTERKRTSQGHSLTGDHRGGEQSRHGAQKEIKKRGAHPLEIAEGKGRSSQDAERKVPSQRHSLPEHRRGRDKLRH